MRGFSEAGALFRGRRFNWCLGFTFFGGACALVPGTWHIFPCWVREDLAPSQWCSDSGSQGPLQFKSSSFIELAWRRFEGLGLGFRV